MSSESEFDGNTTAEVSVVAEAERETEVMAASGSRTLDRRLNPHAPEFVPGLAATMLATKLYDELAPYTRWSNATGAEDGSYGPRYDAIWRESSVRPKPQLNASAVPFVPLSATLRLDAGSAEPAPLQPAEGLAIIDMAAASQLQEPQENQDQRSLKPRRRPFRLPFSRRADDDGPECCCCVCEIM